MPDRGKFTVVELAPAPPDFWTHKLVATSHDGKIDYEISVAGSLMVALECRVLESIGYARD